MPSHLKTCKHKSKDELRKEITDKEATIKQMEQRFLEFEKKLEDVKAENLRLRSRCEQYMTRIRVYEAFQEKGTNKVNEPPEDQEPLRYHDVRYHDAKHNGGGGGGGGGVGVAGGKIASSSSSSSSSSMGSKLIESSDQLSGGQVQETALQKITRLRKLESFQDD